MGLSSLRRSLALVALVLAACLVLSKAANPGFVAEITSKGLDYARQQGIAVLQGELAKLKLPDFSGRAKGKVRYSFYSLVIKNFQLPSSQIVPIPNVGLKVSISNAFAQLAGRWKARKWFIRDRGSFDLKVQGVSVSIGLKLGSDASGRPTAVTSDCSAHISSVSVRISGRFRWLYKLFRGKIESALRKAMVGQICKVVTSSVSKKLEPYLQTMPVTAKIDKVAGIDYSLVRPPVATAQSLKLDLKGEFFSLARRTPFPFSTPALAFSPDPNRMLYFGVSSYFFNTAGFVYEAAGALVFNITNDMIPKKFKFQLNTSSFGALIPQVEKMYPDRLMRLKVSAASAPFLNIAPGNLSLTPDVDIQAYAILENSSLAPLFLLSMRSTISTKIIVSSTKITGSLQLGKMQLTLKHSNVGSFSVQLLQSIMNFFAANVLIPQVNARLAEGFPLPLPKDIQLSNLVISPRQNFLLFGTDVRYG